MQSLDKKRRNSHCELEILEARRVLDSTVVFNEIMYHPEADEVEWLELHNQMAVDMDISSWQLKGGIEFAFPDRTTIPGGGFAVIAADMEKVNAATDLVFGPFQGRLGNGGDDLFLVNRNDRIMDRMQYGDNREWPVAPDGSGTTLAKANPQSGSDDAANWQSSVILGGTPGEANFAVVDLTPTISTVVRPDAVWKYDSSGNDLGTSWREPEFDDANWSQERSIFFAGEFQNIAPPSENQDLETGNAITINNPSFEANTNGGVGYGNVSGWIAAGGTGINPASGGARPFADNGSIPDNRRIAFIQGEGALSQQISGLDTNEQYWLQVHYNARACCGGTAAMTIRFANDTLFPAAPVEPVGGSESYYVASIPFTPRVGSGILSIRNVGGGGDQTLLLDAVNIVSRKDIDHLLVNPSFEASHTSAEKIDLAGLPIAGWEFQGSGDYGVVRDGSFHNNGIIPDGNRALFIEGPGSLTHTLRNLIPGQRFAVQWRANSKSDRPIPLLQLMADGQRIHQSSVFPVGDNDAYHQESVSFTATSSTAQIGFEQANSIEGGQPVLFLDDIRILKIDSPLVTELPIGHSTYYFRTEFEFDGNPDQTELALKSFVDDGAAFYLNGQEIWRTNLPPGEIVHATLAEDEIGDPEFSGQFDIPNSSLQQGSNTLAVEVHQAAEIDSDMAFALELVSTEHPLDPNVQVPDLSIQEISKFGNGFSVELRNNSESELSLEGLKLSVADQVHALPEKKLASREILALDFANVRSDFGDRVFLLDATRNAVIDAIDIDRIPKAKHPDSDEWFFVTENSFGAENSIPLEDAIVINEIMYHDQSTFEYADQVHELSLIEFDSPWRYQDDNTDPGIAWRQVDFDDDQWNQGDSVFHAGDVAIDFAGFVPAGAVAESIDVANPGFEQGRLPASPGYGSISGWTNDEGSGINARSGPFANNLLIPEGARIGFIQGAQSISQTLDGFVPGKKYSVQYRENERGATVAGALSYANLGENPIVAEHDVHRTSRFRRVVSEPFEATAHSYELTIGNARVINSAEDDNALLLDDFQVTRAVPVIANAGFDTTVLPSREFEELPNDQPNIGWQFAGASGISNNRSAIQGTSRSPEGNQTGYLKGISSMSQTISGFETGVTYSISWAERRRRGTPAENELEVVLDAGMPTEIILSDAHTIGDTAFVEVTGKEFVASKSSYTLSFRTLRFNGEEVDTVLLDDIRFHFISEAQELGTEMRSDAQTYYFRQEFDFFEDTSNSELQLKILIDDGAVAYLNGVEIFRENLPAGIVNHATVATQDLPLSRFSDVISAPGTLLRNGKNVFAVELHQSDDSSDTVFAGIVNAIVTTPGSEYATSEQEWIELFNRSDRAIKLDGWSLDDAIDFQFPPGSSIGAGEYVVLAKNQAQFALEFPDVNPVGEFSGGLSNNGELVTLRDALGNPVDRVHYFESGRWPKAADGGGGSLELQDPWADNDNASVWSAGSESIPWRTYSYQARAIEPRGLSTPNFFDEFIFGLLDEGEVLLDDIRVIEDPDGIAVNRIANGGFDSDGIGNVPAGYRIQGNHHGEVVIDPDDPQNRVLRLTATGPTEHMNNHAEVTFANGASISEGAEYEISFQAKWLSGSPQLNSRLYFTKAAKTTILNTPDRVGTPGAENRSRVDVGPTFRDLSHTPVVPNADESVLIRVRADDIDGIAAVQLHYSVDAGNFQTLTMQPAGDGFFEATVPAQQDRDVVQFYVLGIDGNNRESFFPAPGTDSAAMYRVDDDAGPSKSGHSLRLIMNPDDVRFMHTNSNVMGNDRLPATVIYDDTEVFYNVGARLRASGYGRQGGLAGFNLQFPPDQLFRGVHQTIALDRGAVFANPGGGVRGEPGASPHELLIYQIAHHAGGIAGMYDDVVYVDAPRSNNTGMALLKMARYSDVFLDSQFNNGGDGSLYKFELIYHANTTVNGDPESLKRAPNSVIGTDISNLGEDKEAYRWNWILKNNRDRDDFSSIIQLGEAFSTRGNQLDDLSQEIMDVDQWMRTFAMFSLVGVADVYNMGLAHNLELYVRPEDGKVLAFPWDVDHGFVYSFNSNILGRGGSNLKRVIDLPHNKRLFFKHLLDIIDSSFNTDYLNSWTAHYAQATGFDVEATLNEYIDRRANFVADRVHRAAPQIPFEIQTNNGDGFEVDTPFVTLEGQGWVDIDSIHVLGELEKGTVEWLDLNSWRITVPLQNGENQITLNAVDYQNRNVGTDSITITSTARNSALREFLRIDEIMYNPAPPSMEELAVSPAFDNDDFEFLEVLNVATETTLDLSGVRITHGPSQEFSFANLRQSELAPGERILLVNDWTAFQARYGTEINIAGTYAGNLSNGGERIRLEDENRVAIFDFVYGDMDPWPMEPDGNGPSLQLIDAAGTKSDQLGEGQRWRASTREHGTPGFAGGLVGDFNLDGALTADDIDAFCEADANDVLFDLNTNGIVDGDDYTILIEDIFGTTLGDANLDGRFDSRDFVIVFQAGQYEDEIDGNSTWSTGDWNCDGEFSTSDLVAAFQAGGFRFEARPKA